MSCIEYFWKPLDVMIYWSAAITISICMPAKCLQCAFVSSFTACNHAYCVCAEVLDQYGNAAHKITNTFKMPFLHPEKCLGTILYLHTSRLYWNNASPMYISHVSDVSSIQARPYVHLITEWTSLVCRILWPLVLYPWFLLTAGTWIRVGCCHYHNS